MKTIIFPSSVTRMTAHEAREIARGAHINPHRTLLRTSFPRGVYGHRFRPNNFGQGFAA